MKTRIVLICLCFLIGSNNLTAQIQSLKNIAHFELFTSEDASNDIGTYQIVVSNFDQEIDYPENLADILALNRHTDEIVEIELNEGVWLRIPPFSEINSLDFVSPPLIAIGSPFSESQNTNHGEVTNRMVACSPANGNGSLSLATFLTVGDDCLSGTTCGGAGPIAVGTCIPASWDCAFYKFEATDTDMTVFVDFVSSSGCTFRSTVFSTDFLGDPLAQVSCITGVANVEHELTTLVVDETYIVQVCYTQSPQGGCGNAGAANFCIVAIPFDDPCTDCDNLCGQASGFPIQPTVSEVVVECDPERLSPSLDPSSTHTFCNSFNTLADVDADLVTDVEFQVILSSNCSGPGPFGGNVTNFSWELYDYDANVCGATPVQTGNLTNLIFANILEEHQYVYCYTFTVPSTCSHFFHCPYFINAEVLPIELLSFTGKKDGSVVSLNWTTATEINNDFFTLEKSRDGLEFYSIGTVNGAGNSSANRSYEFNDVSPVEGFNYYRLRQTDFDGTTEVFSPISVTFSGELFDLNLEEYNTGQFVLSIFGSDAQQGNISVFDSYGRNALQETVDIELGTNHINLDLAHLKSGVYTLRFGNNRGLEAISFIKQ